VGKLDVEFLRVGGLERADDSAVTILECQSRHVPLRSKSNAFGFEPGIVDM
jgi:hypothetical protein